jgi:hypothetical protein
MSEVNHQIFFQHRDIAELLIKKAGLHDGKWILSVNFGFSPGNFGATPEQAAPGVVVVVMGIGLAQASPESPAALQVDASVVNPATPQPPRKKRVPK